VVFDVIRPTAMVLTVVPFRSLGGSSSTSRVIGIVVCAGTSRGGFISCAGTSRDVIARIVIARIVVCAVADRIINNKIQITIHINFTDDVTQKN